MTFHATEWSISQVMGMLGRSELILQPSFQRFYIWKEATEQMLLDTILRNYPIPPIWLWCHRNEQGRDIFEVIDGQQRLTCIERYKNNLFPFRARDLSPEDELYPAKNAYCSSIPPGINGLALNEDFSQRYWNYRLQFIEVKTQDRQIVIDIFKRLNKTSTNLNQQELLNAFYVGEFKILVYDTTAMLQSDEYWGSRVFKEPKTDRMSIQQFTSELFVALMTGVSQEKNDKVEDYYEQYDMNFQSRATYSSKFNSTLALIKELFPGVTRFTRNQSDFYTLFLFLANLRDQSDINMNADNKDTIRSTLLDFEQKLAEFLDGGLGLEARIFEEYNLTIRGPQREKEYRDRRMAILSELIRPALQKTDKDPIRVFSEQQKLYIWNSSRDKVCEICGQAVDAFDDYEPDHVVPWSRGGKTSITNGRVTHSLCNRRRGNRE